MAQTIRTFRSISLITVSSLPLSTCFAKLRVNPFTVWNGECDGMASAKGSTTASTTTGPSLYASASAKPSRTSSGSSIPNSFRAHCFSNLRKIWILEFHSKRNEAGLLLFDMDEVELLVV